MNSALLVKIFGREQRWIGPCTIIMDSDAAVQTLGTDSIIGGGAKSYAPRMVSGRIPGDAACMTQDGAAVIVMQQQKFRSSTGEERVQQTLIVTDASHVVAVEFPDTATLATLGVSAPVIRPSGSHHGTPRPT